MSVCLSQATARGSAFHPCRGWSQGNRFSSVGRMVRGTTERTGPTAGRKASPGSSPKSCGFVPACSGIDMGTRIPLGPPLGLLRSKLARGSPQGGFLSFTLGRWSQPPKISPYFSGVKCHGYSKSCPHEAFNSALFFAMEDLFCEGRDILEAVIRLIPKLMGITYDRNTGISGPTSAPF